VFGERERKRGKRRRGERGKGVRAKGKRGVQREGQRNEAGEEEREKGIKREEGKPEMRQQSILYFVKVAVKADAPAWPIRRPGGAVRPAMNPTTGLGLARVLLYFSKNSAASSSIEPPISPMMTIPSVRGSSRRMRRASTWVVLVWGWDVELIEDGAMEGKGGGPAVRGGKRIWGWRRRRRVKWV
jgi:hypothetical protein